MRLSAALLAASLAIPAFAPPSVLAQPATPPVAAPAAPGAENVPAGRPDSFAPLARRLLPAVVNVSTTIGGGPPARARGPNARPDAPDVPQAPPGSPFEEFFRDFLNRNRPPGDEGPGGQAPGPGARRGNSLGSGFIVDPSGIIVTNNHVIDGASEINVILQDNTTLRAELVGTDPRTDIAVLRVRHNAPLPFVPWGDSDTAEVGDWVLAIGNPFGLGGTVTAGIVSARGRDIRQGPFDDFIQTDAAINRGNSGGPLFNTRGEVVGINTAIYSPSGGSIGIGFSIPSNLARGIARQLAEGGRVRRGWLGVNIQQVTDEIAESLGLRDGTKGALVARVQEGTPAAEAGIRNGDVVLRFNNQEVRDMRSLPRIVAETAVGTRAPVVLWRDGREVTVHVTLGELPPEQQLASAEQRAVPQPGRPTEIAGLGIRVAGITPELRERLRLRPDQRGVAVVEVAPNSPAAEREIRPGDIILEVQQERVNTAQELTERVERLRRQGRGTALFLVEGQNGQRFVPLRLGAAR
ncbi:DegQ family serine endoprotease [Rhodovarius lipocyclicus]|uniref:DegQ family serine endoprotease n=1 Tax=Rhodovarius lipocyclicus TaxID=268410 RepID=UPI001358BC04|nr:DegQ family serine endoprotease [Rhodovarius lipocyclicus]